MGYSERAVGMLPLRHIYIVIFASCTWSIGAFVLGYWGVHLSRGPGSRHTCDRHGTAWQYLRSNIHIAISEEKWLYSRFRIAISVKQYPNSSIRIPIMTYLLLYFSRDIQSAHHYHWDLSTKIFVIGKFGACTWSVGRFLLAYFYWEMWGVQHF